MAFLLRRSIVGPVQRLTDVAGRIAAGDIEARAPAEARDEIGMLAENFNSMTARLAQTIKRLRRSDFVNQMQVDVDQRRLAGRSADYVRIPEFVQ